jgi:hypothetical protein
MRNLARKKLHCSAVKGVNLQQHASLSRIIAPWICTDIKKYGPLRRRARNCKKKHARKLFSFSTLKKEGNFLDANIYLQT